MKAGKMIKIFKKVGYYEGWEDYQTRPSSDSGAATMYKLKGQC